MRVGAPVGRLLVVGTPIGNLSDLSPRVGDALAAADAVLCEDTRVTGKLLNHLGLRKPLERCDENVIGRRSEGLVERMLAGDTLAFASDAGMPGVSDPGQVLVDAALDAGVPVEVVPGPSAVVCAVAASGLPCASFFFGGFLPRKAGEKACRLEALAAVPGALVFYESPHRVADTLAAVAERFPLRRVALVRELTKVHEECRRGLAPELAAAVAADEAEGRAVRGECAIVVEGPVAGESAPAEEDPGAVAAELLGEGLSASRAAKELAKRCGMARSDAYDLLLSLK
ncbi:16S rRNA (cytidine(1402)-2'-O)-methyltransferase [Olsenella sp. YH-ols2216]|nr:16S rRNA (cytidine(1402)-2'-O)-methyltransferase [Olsenella sp. YH-ols2216]